MLFRFQLIDIIVHNTLNNHTPYYRQRVRIYINEIHRIWQGRKAAAWAELVTNETLKCFAMASTSTDFILSFVCFCRALIAFHSQVKQTQTKTAQLTIKVNISDCRLHCDKQFNKMLNVKCTSSETCRL